MFAKFALGSHSLHHIFMLEWLNNLPPPLATAVIAMIPFAELRAAIPIALGVYKMQLPSAIFFSVLGDMVPSVLILLFIGRTSSYLREKSALMERIFFWWFANVEKSFSKDKTRYGLMALFFFVAIPFPGTGSWSGAVAAFLFGLPFFPSLASILGGVLVSAGLVAGASLGVLVFF